MGARDVQYKVHKSVWLDTLHYQFFFQKCIHIAKICGDLSVKQQQKRNQKIFLRVKRREKEQKYQLSSKMNPIGFQVLGTFRELLFFNKKLKNMFVMKGYLNKVKL